jgi:hypothetical protein
MLRAVAVVLHIHMQLPLNEERRGMVLGAGIHGMLLNMDSRRLLG